MKIKMALLSPAVLLAMACSKTINTPTPGQDGFMSSKNGQNQSAALTFTAGDTILNANYENGQPNSGITGLEVTGATATDAAYIVSPGGSGNYAIAHKTVLEDSGYYSAGAYRSESATGQVQATRFLLGMERRYEFSVLLKDWVAYDPTKPPHGNTLFQLKETGDYNVTRFFTKRNGLFLAHSDGSETNLISDFRPYVNQWMRFRVDAKWASDTTGYLKIYGWVPGQSGYALILSITGKKTYYGPGVGQHGYLKWGMYGGAKLASEAPATRIAYHDDIRIIALN